MQQGPFDQRDWGRQPVPAPPGRTADGRRRTPVDTGTVAIAMSMMTYYWLMPALMSRRKRRRPEPGTPDSR